MREILDRVQPTNKTNTAEGRLSWAPAKSIWFTCHLIFWAVVGSIYFSWGAVLSYLGLSILILCGGHSLGMHRKLIHDSFDCPLWLARLGAYLGTLVGLGGPFTMMLSLIHI